MFTLIFTTLSHRWRTAILAILAVVAMPSLALAVSTTDVVEMFKYTYGVDRMIYLASVETVLWNLLKRRKKEIDGRGQWIIPYHTQNAGHFVGIPEAGTLPTVRPQPDTAEATFSLVEFAAVWDVSWKMLRQAARGKSAFETALNFMDTSIKRRVFRVINAQLCSFSGMGELGIMPNADNQTTISLNSLPFADKGMIVDLVDASDDSTLLVNTRTVTAVNVRSREVTLSGAAPAGTAAGDYLVPNGQISGGTSYSMFGLGSIIDDSNPRVANFGNIDRTVAGNEYYQGNVMENGGVLRAFTEDLLIEGENLMRDRGGVQPSRYIANSNILKRYHGDLIVDRYFAFNKIQGLGEDGKKAGFGRGGMDLEGGESGTGGTPYTLSGKPFHCEPYFPANKILGFHDDHFWIGHDGIEVPTPLSDIFDEMTPYFHMKSTPSAAFDVWHYWEAQLVSDNPQAGIQFADIAES